MARDRANIRIDMWADQDWRELTGEAQRLYMQLLSHPTLNYAGVADWHPGRLAAMASDLTAGAIERAASELVARFFIVIDESTAEVLVRSFVKHDGLLKQPKMVVSMTNAYAAVASKSLREVIAFEVQKLHDREPDLAAWRVKQTETILRAASIDVHSLTPGVTPLFTPDLTLGFTPGVTPNAGQSQGLPTSTTTSTATSKDNVQPPAERSPYSKAFEEWWPHYPKRESKGDAFKAWESTRKARTLPPLPEMIAAADAYRRKTANSDPQFIKLAGGWIRDRKWEDETVTMAESDSWAAYRG